MRIPPEASSSSFEVRPSLGDGNCLFRSVSQQVYGDEEWHDRVREECMDFIAKEESHFGQFILGDFLAYVHRKKALGCCGDNCEIQAMAELYNRQVQVFVLIQEPASWLEATTTTDEDENIQLVKIENESHRVKQINIFHNKYSSDETGAPIRLLYRGKSHYDAVIDPYAATVGVGLGLPGFQPGKAEHDLMKSAKLAADLEATEEELERAALQQSLQELIENQRVLVQKKDSESSVSFVHRKRPLIPSPPKSNSTSKKMKKMLFSDGITSATSSSSAASSSSLRPSTSPPLALPLLGGDVFISPAMRELIMNGFPVEQVLIAKTVAGDSFDAMLAVLVSNIGM